MGNHTATRARGRAGSGSAAKVSPEDRAVAKALELWVAGRLYPSGDTYRVRPPSGRGMGTVSPANDLLHARFGDWQALDRAANASLSGRAAQAQAQAQAQADAAANAARYTAYRSARLAQGVSLSKAGGEAYRAASKRLTGFDRDYVVNNPALQGGRATSLLAPIDGAAVRAAVRAASQVINPATRAVIGSRELSDRETERITRDLAARSGGMKAVYAAFGRTDYSGLTGAAIGRLVARESADVTRPTNYRAPTRRRAAPEKTA